MSHENKHSLSNNYPESNFAISLMLMISTVTFISGISLPFLTITKFFIFADQISILSGLWQLLKETEIVLFIVIFLFTIALPSLKIIFLMIFWYGDFSKKDDRKKYVDLIHKVGKWSMLDVFVVAILVVSIKTGILVKTEIHSGLYCFLVSIILTMIATSKILHIAEENDDSQAK